MKNKPLFLALFLIVFVLFLFPIASLLLMAAMHQRTFDYSLSQPLDQVEKVEILAYDDRTETSTPLLVLGESQANTLLTDIDVMPCKKHFGDHPTSYGKAVVYITYANGEAEVIGIENVAKVDTSGKWHISGEYFDHREFCTLLLQYVPELLPELQIYLD